MKFNKYQNQWPLSRWQEVCPENSYQVVSPQDLPEWLPASLTDKFNTAVFAASGNTTTYVVIIMGYRIDKTEIDEHPFVVSFDKTTENQFSGFLEHGNWSPGRTTPIPEEMRQQLAISGTTVDFNFERKPAFQNGTLEDLRQQGIFNGYEATVREVQRRKGITS